MELKIQVVSQANVTVVRCQGRLVYGPEAEALVCTLRRLLISTKHIVVQLAGVAQIDSSGVGALGAVFMAAHNREAEIKLASLSSRVEEVLRITGLEQLFDIHRSEAEAIAAFLKTSNAAIVC